MQKEELEEDEKIQQRNSYLGIQSDPEREEQIRQTREEKRQERVEYLKSKEDRKNLERQN